jgi:hypothetical protein
MARSIRARCGIEAADMTARPDPRVSSGMKAASEGLGTSWPSSPFPASSLAATGRKASVNDG